MSRDQLPKDPDIRTRTFKVFIINMCNEVEENVFTVNAKIEYLSREIEIIFKTKWKF